MDDRNSGRPASNTTNNIATAIVSNITHLVEIKQNENIYDA